MKAARWVSAEEEANIAGRLVLQCNFTLGTLIVLEINYDDLLRREHDALRAEAAIYQFP